MADLDRRPDSGKIISQHAARDPHGTLLDARCRMGSLRSRSPRLSSCQVHVTVSAPFSRAPLKLGTRAENAADRNRKGRTKGPTNPWIGSRGANPAICGEQNKLAKLTEKQVREIRRRWNLGECTQTQMAAEYGVTQNLISKIVLRRTWRHI